jgi:hypothetical protein
MGATLTPAQLAKLAPEHLAMIQEAEAEMRRAQDTGYRVCDALSLAMTCGYFTLMKRADVRDLLLSACADGTIQCEPHGRADYNIDRDSFHDWLETYAPVWVECKPEPDKLDLSLWPVIVWLIIICWSIKSILML